MGLTAAEIAGAVREGRLTAREAVSDALARIEAVDASVGAYQEVRVFAALPEADEVDARPDGAELPLAGVPVAIKDNVPVTGEPMRIGSSGTDATPQDHDHEVVRRLRAAGAVVVGLTRGPELCGFGAPHSVYRITPHPWNPQDTPRGPSRGAGAPL